MSRAVSTIRTFDLSRPEKPRSQGLGRMMAGGRGTNPRRKNDLYDTPWEVTEALYRAEYAAFARWTHAWDPACGNGALLEVLEAHGVGTLATDLIDRGVGLPGSYDFLKAPTLLSPMIVTNPPFSLARAFIEKALRLEVPFLALLLKATFFHARSRMDLFEACPPSRIHPLSWRPDFNGKRAPVMECAWFVWEAGVRGPSLYGPPLARPDGPSPWNVTNEIFCEEGAP